MKTWPADRLVDYEDIMAPLREAWDRLQSGHAADYDGYDHWSPCMPPISDELAPDGLAYHKERGRDETDAVLHCAFRLGMTQGVREWKQLKWEFVDHYLKTIERSIGNTYETMQLRAMFALGANP